MVSSRSGSAVLQTVRQVLAGSAVPVATGRPTLVEEPGIAAVSQQNGPIFAILLRCQALGYKALLRTNSNQIEAGEEKDGTEKKRTTALAAHINEDFGDVLPNGFSYF